MSLETWMLVCLSDGPARAASACLRTASHLHGESSRVHPGRLPTARCFTTQSLPLNASAARLITWVTWATSGHVGARRTRGSRQITLVTSDHVLRADAPEKVLPRGVSFVACLPRHCRPVLPGLGSVLGQLQQRSPIEEAGKGACATGACPQGGMGSHRTHTLAGLQKSEFTKSIAWVYFQQMLGS